MTCVELSVAEKPPWENDYTMQIIIGIIIALMVAFIIGALS